jgi:cell division protein FtsB
MLVKEIQEMSYNEMQKYINKLFEENKQLKEELNKLKSNLHEDYVKEYALNLMFSDNEFLYKVMDTASAISKSAIRDTYYHQEKEYNE